MATLRSKIMQLEVQQRIQHMAHTQEIEPNDPLYLISVE
jgi:hypothetical protein